MKKIGEVERIQEDGLRGQGRGRKGRGEHDEKNKGSGRIKKETNNVY